MGRLYTLLWLILFSPFILTGYIYYEAKAGIGFGIKLARIVNGVITDG